MFYINIHIRMYYYQISLVRAFFLNSETTELMQDNMKE